jgi:hypothetical protein
MAGAAPARAAALGAETGAGPVAAPQPPRGNTAPATQMIVLPDAGGTAPADPPTAVEPLTTGHDGAEPYPDEPAAPAAAPNAAPAAAYSGTPATGTPATGTPATGTPATGTPATGMPASGAAPATAPVDGSTQVLGTPAAASNDGPGLRDRLAPAGAAVGRRADELADRYRTAPPDVRLALIGTVVVVLSFLFLPYAAGTGSAAGHAARLWWRPLAAVVATVLLATTLRPRRRTTGTPGTSTHTSSSTDRLLAALVIATVGATEAGLVGLVSGDAEGARIGYYGMLAGLVTVLFATVRAARRRCGAPVPHGDAAA